MTRPRATSRTRTGEMQAKLIPDCCAVGGSSRNPPGWAKRMERESIGRGVALQHKISALNNLNRKVHFGELKWLKSLISMTTFTKLPPFSAAFLQVAGTWAAYGRHWK